MDSMEAVSTLLRRRILIQGIVQGVGFRPFVYGQAHHYGLYGFVLNNSSGVTIEVEGPVTHLDAFQRALVENAPSLARIDTLAVEQISLCLDTSFVIAHSQSSSERLALISPDTSTCTDCLQELFDSTDRRYRYPFINCTNCGPRFTIVQGVPYDRANTTMSVFPQCPDCQAEYDDPLSRRFHAQPNACPVCGPQMQLIERDGQPVSSSDPIEDAAQRLAHGQILAVKGLGGYHLACDACNEEAVEQLRRRKRREAKPFALMVPDLETARQLCTISADEAKLLQAYRRPIVLLQQSPDCPVASSVAPVHNTLGMMLPYAPLHYLLLHAFSRCISQGRPAALVMTSGNVSDEPIAYRDEDAYARLATIADAFLTHNRAIHMRCDDTVMRVAAQGEQFFRRSRGYAPEPLSLSHACPVPILACGGHLKNTFCLGKGKQAFLSHHIGDLDNLETLISFREGIEHYKDLFGIVPQLIAHDLHPEYLATKYALDSDIPHKIGVQHHHAHIASVLAEHGLEGPVIGVAADGTGYGTDGAVWGCEVMVADLLDFQRAAYLAYVPLPGGEQAIRQPWRMTAVYLAQAYGDAFLNLDIPFVQEMEQRRWHTLAQMIAHALNTPPTSSLGRLFDAVAVLLGLTEIGTQADRENQLYEGQAAIEMEMRAAALTTDISSYPFKLHAGSPLLLDVTPLIRAIVQDIQRGIPAPQIAAKFHYTIAQLLAEACRQASERTQIRSVALSGGVFQNRLLLEQLTLLLERQGFQVYTNRRVPPNDGGLSLGQLAIAVARTRSA
ncbi:MAG: carbamoyltransferase HypF [Chloroflexota bacterium]|nr:carbamoyltransferase HypF [Chloroflexota bacterium]